MDSRSLIIAHKGYYQLELKAWNYDNYLSNKNHELWNQPTLPENEIEKLFTFIRSWDRWFRGDEYIFQGIYEEIYEDLISLRDEKFEFLNLSDRTVMNKIKIILDKVADCTLKKERFESTDASKILQTINPDLFIMWDRKIRQGRIGDENYYTGKHYINSFIPRMKKELNSAVTRISEIELNSEDDVLEYIKRNCDNKSMAKILDEYNFVIYTIPHKFGPYLKSLKIELPSDLKEFVEK